MNRSHQRSSRTGVTLIEMLVVIGIIVLLAAMITPAAYGALIRARNFAMSAEINSLEQAIQKYKLDQGDFPPSFGDTSLVLRHMAKCYPRIDAAHLNDFITRLNNAATSTTPYIDIDQSEALVFWLSATYQNNILPFNYPAVDPMDGVMPAHFVDANATARKYFDFDVRRLEDPDGDGFYSFKPQYAKATYYVYIDSRMYLYHMNYPAPMMGTKPAARMSALSPTNSVEVVRPYFSDTPDTSNPFGFKFMNPTTYQILCAGQDGEWHNQPLLTPAPTSMTKRGIIRWPSGTEYDGTAVYGNTAYPGSTANYDNLSNFSEGKTFKAAQPAP